MFGMDENMKWTKAREKIKKKIKKDSGIIRAINKVMAFTL